MSTIKKLTRRELYNLIQTGESLFCDFKLKFSSHHKIAKELIAFANTRGGYLIFGIDDNKRVIGVHSEKEESELIKQAANEYCAPPVQIEFVYFDLEGREIVVALIPESDEKPHRIQDYKNEFDLNSSEVYVRVRDKSIPASKEMKRLLRTNINDGMQKYFIGETEKKVFSYLEKNESIDVKILKTLANISERRASRTLVKMVRANLLIIHTKDNGDEFFTQAV